MIENIENLSENDLVKRLGEVVIGTPSGLEAQQAQAELIRRQIVETRNQIIESKQSSQTAEKYSYVLTGLTFVMLAVGFIQILIAISLSDKSKLEQNFLMFLTLVSIFGLLIYVAKDWKNNKK